MSDLFRSPGGIVITTRSAPTFVDVDFAAPLGRRVRLVTLMIGVIVTGFVFVDLGLAMSRAKPPAPLGILLLAPLVIVGVSLPVAWFSQICGYRLTGSELVVLRRNRQTRFAFAELSGVTADPEAMAWSVKIFGNDGLGAITGRFRNRRLGFYQALVTDRPRAVVLRWPGRCLVVSPDRPEEFVREVRARAGLRD